MDGRLGPHCDDIRGFIDRMEKNEEITAKCLNEKDFKKIVGQKLLEEVYARIRKEQQPAQ